MILSITALDETCFQSIAAPNHRKEQRSQQLHLTVQARHNAAAAVAAQVEP